MLLSELRDEKFKEVVLFGRNNINDMAGRNFDGILF